jgi:antibiotic biosynthesis monooxygenase (ABM) superfamily enzyme
MMSTSPVLSRVFISPLCLTPLMAYFFIPLSTGVLAGWLHKNASTPSLTAETASDH